MASYGSQQSAACSIDGSSLTRDEWQCRKMLALRMEARLLAQAQLSKQPPTQRKRRKPALPQLQILQKLWTLQTRRQRQVLGCLRKSSKKWGSWLKGDMVQHAGQECEQDVVSMISPDTHSTQA